MNFTIRKVDRMVLKGIRIGIALLMCLMFCCIMLEVALRYLVSSPPFWTEESARYIMFYIVLGGSALAIRKEQHPALLFLLEKLPEKFQKKWRLFIDGLICVILLVILKEGLMMAIDEKIMKTPALRISFFWVYLAFPLGSVLMILEILAKHLFGKDETDDGQEGVTQDASRRLTE